MADPSTRIDCVGLLFQPYKEETRALAQRLDEFLRERGYKTSVLSAFELDESQTRGLGLAITLGGDGTVLRAARWLAARSIPILAVRMGTLSFLGELAPEELFEHVEAYLARDFWVDQRAMLRVRLGETTALALNDVVIERGGIARALRLEVRVNGARVERLVTDGLVVATATGSTGYALAAGGPILAPDLEAILLQPIAAHLASLRSLVLPPTVLVELSILSHHPGVLTVDGQMEYPISPGQEVQLSVADQCTVFARRRSRDEFYRTLTSKLVRDPGV